MQSPSRTAGGIRSEGFILFLLFFPDLRRGRVSRRSAGNPSSALSQIHGISLCLFQVVPQPFLVWAGKNTNTHKKRIFYSVFLPLAPSVNTPRRAGSTPGMGRCQHSCLAHSALALTTLCYPLGNSLKHNSTPSLILQTHIFLKKEEWKKKKPKKTTLLKYVNDIE